MIKSIVLARMKRLLQRCGLQLRYFPSAQLIPLAYWDDDPAFLTLWCQTEPRTLVDKRRCFLLYQYAQQVRSLQGDAAEVGVYRGGTARLLAKALEQAGCRMHLFDTFAGMPTTDPAADLHQAGDFSATSLATVQQYLADCRNVAYYPGLFPATAAPIEHIQFRLVHVDVDIYQSTWDCCAFFYPRLVAGGVLMFDDYGLATCPGVKAAVDAFFATRPEYPVYLPTGQAVVVRLAAAE